MTYKVTFPIKLDPEQTVPMLKAAIRDLFFVEEKEIDVEELEN